MKPSLLIKTLKPLILARHNVLLVGKPGVGKTRIVHQVAKTLGADIILAHPVVDDPTDYKGMPCIIEDQDGTKRAVFMPFGNLEQAIHAKQLTVYFIDDIGQAPPAVQAACMQLLGAHSINGQVISPHVVFLAATNKKEHKGNVKGILEPVKSRFVTIIEVETDTEDWIYWACQPENNIPAELVAFIRLRPEFLEDFQPTSDMTNSPVPRTVENVGKLFHLKDIPMEARHEVFKGAAGDGLATEFTHFLEVYKKLPNPAAVIADPDNFVAPNESEADVIYALCTALSRMASDNNASRFFAVAKKFIKEFAVKMVRDAISRTPSLQVTKEFNQWVAEHKDLYF